MAPSSELVVLVARRDTHVVVLDVLRDWSSLGLVAPVVLVDVDALRAGELLMPALVLDGGTSRATTLQDEVSSRRQTSIVRVCALTEVGQRVIGPDDATGMAVVAALTSALPGVDVSRLHLVGVALQGARLNEDIGWLGWHNVVVAPENAQSPAVGVGVSPIVYRPGDPVRATHFAAAVSSLCGLWAGEPSAPLDERPVAPGHTLVAVRTYTRHLSAEAVESELFSRLASVAHGYPVPLVDGSSAWQIDDQVGAATEMAEKLLEKHPSLGPRHREMPRSTPPQRVGAMQALKMMFSFLGAALRNAPRAFVDKVLHDVSRRGASAVERMVFGGGGSEYEVVVRGVKADGTPASWGDVDEALERATKDLDERAELVHSSKADLTQFWKDYVAGGLTLLDAGLRSQELPPVMSGSRRGIITQGGRVAPDPSDVFVPPDNVAAFITRPAVAPNDVVAARAVASELDSVGQRQPHMAGQTHSVGQTLREWFGAHERTYSGRIGLRIAQGVARVREEIIALADALRSAQQAPALPAMIEDQQRRLARALKIIVLVALLVAAAVILVTVLGPLGVVFLVIGLLVTVIGWVVSSLLAFMRGQRDLFALLHRRRELADQTEILRQHLLEALADLRRLSRAYRQYLDWSTAFGRFVASPMGTPPSLVDDEVVLGNGFPRNHRFGAARPDDRVLDETASQLRRDLFGVGWASEAWEAFLQDVPADMGTQAFRIRENVDLLFADPGVADESLLTAWSQAVAGRADWAGARDPLRARISQDAERTGGGLWPRVLAQVETRDTSGRIETVTYEDFVSHLDDVGALESGNAAFTRELFGQTPNEPWRVAQTLSKQSSARLGRTIVVTQFSQGFPAYELRLDPPSDQAAQPGQPAQWDAPPTAQQPPPLI